MRPILAAMRRAGIVRSRFSARFALQDHRGFIALEDVQTPIGIIDHAWVRPGNWNGPIPRRGEHVEFRAEIQIYWRESGEPDLGLFRCTVVAV